MKITKETFRNNAEVDSGYHPDKDGKRYRLTMRVYRADEYELYRAYGSDSKDTIEVQEIFFRGSLEECVEEMNKITGFEDEVTK